MLLSFKIIAILVAAPLAFADRLENDLVVTLATDWPDGTVEMVPGKLLDEVQFGPEQNQPRSRNIGDLQHNITVDDKPYKDIYALIFKDVPPPDSPDDNMEFKVWRAKWGDWKATVKICKVSIVEDPHVPVVHVLITGEDEVRVNGFENQVHLDCHTSE